MTALRLYTDGSYAAPVAVSGWAWILVSAHAVASDSGAIPGSIRYRFRCEVCGDRFTLAANTRDGQGGWTRQGEETGDVYASA